MNPDNYKIMIAEIDRQQQMVKASVFMETLDPIIELFGELRL